MNTPTPHQETPQAALLRRGNDYAEFERVREERERVTPHDDQWATRESLWLNDRLPLDAIPARFHVTKYAIGPFYKMHCHDRVTGREQLFSPGHWGFMEAWMAEQQEVRS